MATAVANLQEQMAPAEPGQLAITWKRFRRHKLGLVGLATLTLLILSVIFIPILTEVFWHFTFESINDVNVYAPAGTLASTGGVHIIGTDEIGRDNLTRLFYGGRISLTVGIVTTIVVVVIGSIVGALAGFYGGLVDTVLMRTVDLLLSIPTLPILLIMSKLLLDSGLMSKVFGGDLGPVATIILVLSLFGWLGLSRLIRGSILSLRGLDFIEATRALGASNRRIILRHLMPNSIAPIIVSATLAVGDFIVSEAFLSFLGLGIPPKIPSWGNLLQNAQGLTPFITELNPAKEIRGYLVLFPGLLLLTTVLSINFMGDALRDALDPRLKV